MPASVHELMALHSAFWDRKLDEPIVNAKLSLAGWYRHVPALPPQWNDQDGLMLEPHMLSPDQLQPTPRTLEGEDATYSDVAFNVLCPYHRIPWLPAIVGCALKVSATAQTIWPISYLKDDWHELDNQGFAPRLDWLDRLLQFVRHICDRYYPDRCIPAQDMITRGTGDLALNTLGSERFFLGLYDHPEEMKFLLQRITDLYIHWAEAQLEVIPQTHGGYCNQYGIWCPGRCILFQQDYAVSLSEALFDAFIMPTCRRVADAFDYSVIHTHSGFPQLAQWMLGQDELTAIQVALDPNGPSLEESIPVWNDILDRKPLIISGPLTAQQLDMLLAKLSPSGLWLDVDLVTEEELARGFHPGSSTRPQL